MNITCISSINLTQLDLFNLVFIPIICVFGMITNLFNIIVFVNPKMKKPTFRLMFIMSVNDFIYLGLCFPLSIVFCENCQQAKYSEWYTNYLIYIDEYLTSGQAIFCILIEIVLSVDRYRIITNKKYVNNFSYRWRIMIAFILSALFFLPVIFFQKKTTRNSECSSLVNLENKLPLLSLILTMIRLMLGVIVLSVINFINLAKFSKMFRVKAFIKNELKRPTLYDIKDEATDQQQQQQQQQSQTIPVDNLKEMKASRNMTLLVLFTCGKYIYILLLHILLLYLTN